MTDDPQTQIDPAIAEMFARRASRGTSDGLRDSILTAVRIGPQRRGPLARLRDVVDGRGMGRVLALALVGTAVIAGMLAFAAGSSRGPDPSDDHAVVVSPSGSPSVTPVPSDASPVPRPGAITGPWRTVDFVKPFSLVIPADLQGAWLLQDHGRIFALTVGQDPTLPPDGTDWGVRGFAVVVLLEPLVHPCVTSKGDSRIPIRTDPVGIVEDLRDISGIILTQVGSTQVDGHDAVVFDLAPGPCPFNDIHVAPGLSSGKYVPTNRPARLILTTVDESPMGILIWADTPEQLGAWVDQVQPMVDSIHFRD